jgi:uncharacterized surface protein with fasciclin (FAS1) repeats
MHMPLACTPAALLLLAFAAVPALSTHTTMMEPVTVINYPMPNCQGPPGEALVEYLDNCDADDDNMVTRYNLNGATCAVGVPVFSSTFSSEEDCRAAMTLDPLPFGIGDCVDHPDGGSFRTSCGIGGSVCQWPGVSESTLQVFHFNSTDSSCSSNFDGPELIMANQCITADNGASVMARVDGNCASATTVHWDYFASPDCSPASLLLSDNMPKDMCGNVFGSPDMVVSCLCPPPLPGSTQSPNTVSPTWSEMGTHDMIADACAMAPANTLAAQLCASAHEHNLYQFLEATVYLGLFPVLADSSRTITVFAPTDRAFNKIHPTYQQFMEDHDFACFGSRTLLSHMVEGVVQGADIMHTSSHLTLTTLNEFRAVELILDTGRRGKSRIRGRNHINKVRVAEKDVLMASNGVLHTVDRILKFKKHRLRKVPCDPSM